MWLVGTRAYIDSYAQFTTISLCAQIRCTCCCFPWEPNGYAVPGLASVYLTVGSAQSMIQHKQVEALITGTSPPIVALIPSAGGGGRWEWMVTGLFLAF